MSMGSQAGQDEAHRLATLKAMRRLLPLLCVIYFLSFIDRTNVGMAKSALQHRIAKSAPRSMASAPECSSGDTRSSKCQATS